MSTGIYMGLTFFLSPTSDNAGILGTVLPVAAIFPIGVSFLLREQLGTRAVKALELPVVEESDPNAESMFRDQVPTREVIGSPDESFQEGLKAIYSGRIVGFALADIPAVFGIVLFISGGDALISRAMILLGTGVMAAHFPSEASVRSQIERGAGAVFPD